MLPWQLREPFPQAEPIPQSEGCGVQGEVGRSSDRFNPVQAALALMSPSSLPHPLGKRCQGLGR